jgi:1-deoxy-D-xylulose-5-phosphate synthase
MKIIIMVIIIMMMMTITAGDVRRQHKVCILSIGTRLMESVIAARELESLHSDVSVTVADARFLKPLDTQLVTRLAMENEALITIEEGSSGGFGAAVLQFVSDEGLLDSGSVKVRTMVIPDIWIEHGPQKDQYDVAKLNHPHIVAKAESLLKDLRRNHNSSSRYDTETQTERVLTGYIKNQID